MITWQTIDWLNVPYYSTEFESASVVRAHELARDLGLPTKDVMPNLRELGYAVKSPSSRVERVKGEGLLPTERQALMGALSRWIFEASAFVPAHPLAHIMADMNPSNFRHTQEAFWVAYDYDPFGED